jgi:hypothetical protein
VAAIPAPIRRSGAVIISTNDMVASTLNASMSARIAAQREEYREAVRGVLAISSFEGISIHLNRGR